MDAHQQIDKVVRFVVTVDAHREDVREKEDELEQTGEDGVEGVNEQDKLKKMGEAECVEETVLARVESVNAQHLNVQVENNQSGLSDSPPPQSSMEMTVKWSHINK
jgi:hypothetical protein